MPYLSVVIRRFIASIATALALVPSALADLALPLAEEQSELFLPTPQLLNRTSSLGRGLEFRYDVSRSVKLRVEFNDSIESSKDRSADFDYRLSFKQRSSSYILDWHPFSGSFRASAGFIINEHEISGIGVYNGSLSDGSRTLTGSELGAVVGTVDFRRYAPYFGIGWSSNESRRSRLRYSLDLGLMYHGQPNVELNAHGPAVEVARQIFPADVNALLADEERKTKDDLADFRYYPVVSFGLAYRF